MIQNIQALRFFAALWVAAHHLHNSLPLGDSWVGAFAVHGYAGVDLFFVISGYIMAHTSADNLPGWRGAWPFLAYRLARIYCGWWPIFTLLLILGWYAGTLSEQVNFWTSFWLWPSNYAELLFPITWTLSFELLFYGVTALMLLGKREQVWRWMLLWAAVLVLCNAYWVAHGYYLPENYSKVSKVQWFTLNPLALEFIAGFLLHGYLQRGNRVWPWLLQATAFLAGITLVHFHARAIGGFGLAAFYESVPRTLLWGGFAIGVLACAVRLESRGWCTWRWLRQLGDGSYSLYLGHLIAFPALFALLSYLTQTLPNLLRYLLVLVLTVCLCQAFFWALERPLYRWVRAKLQGFTASPTQASAPSTKSA